jgi:hypothetical protein
MHDRNINKNLNLHSQPTNDCDEIPNNGSATNMDVGKETKEKQNTIILMARCLAF